MYRIKFIREEKEILVEPGTRILEAERKANLVPDAPCGGRGKCGKCRVKIEDHMVLACQTEIYSDLEIHCPDAKKRRSLQKECRDRLRSGLI